MTDFLPAERARGITIQSAAITFTWPNERSSNAQDSTRLRRQQHNINLIDTPGHADFSFEVIRSLRVLDGIVCVLDGVAGVEAQTEKVWAQSRRYDIPAIIYINKLDRDGAAFAKTVRDVASRLNVWPAVCQIPWWNADRSALRGLGDVVSLRGLAYESGSDGRLFTQIDLPQLETLDLGFANELKNARRALVDLLSEHDEAMIETLIECEEDHLQVREPDVLSSLRRVTLQTPQNVVAIYAGSSLKNIGIQALLDAVVDLLPSPLERPETDILVDGVHTSLDHLLAAPGDASKAISQMAHSRHGKPLSGSKVPTALTACALAFKVVGDLRRAVLVYVRVYSGSITRPAHLYNTNLGISEKANRLMRMNADESVDIDAIHAGQIGVIPGLKHARTGDTLIVYSGINPKSSPPAPLDSMQLRPIDVPPPVFFASIEPYSLSEQKNVEECLKLLLREDPSLSVRHDEESGQTQLAGMGELHLEIAGDRLVNDLRAKARFGEIQVGYREAITVDCPPQRVLIDREIAGRAAKAACTASVASADDSSTSTIRLSESNRLKIVAIQTDETGARIPATDEHMSITSLTLQALNQAIRSGVAAALSQGPSHGFQMHSVHATIEIDVSKDIFPSTSPASISAAARLAVRKALTTSSSLSNGTMLMEPVMNVVLTVDEASLGDVVQDITSVRGGQIISLDSENSDSNEDTDSSNANIIDVSKVYAPPEPFASSQDQGSQIFSRTRQIEARVPLRDMVGYLKHLRSLSAGRGTFVMTVDKFEKMGAHRMKAALASIYGRSN